MSEEPSKKTAVIVNPYSANGRTRKKWPDLEVKIREAIGDFTVYITERPGHASALTRQALREGHDRIVSVGGDGTHHEVVNGFFDGYLTINPAASLAIFPHGTGSDLVRTVGVTTTEEALAALKEGHTLNVDLGRSTFTQEDGEPKARYFINVADFGAGGAVVERVNGAKKRLGPMLTFFVALIRTVFTFKSPLVRLQVNGEIIEQRSLAVIIANGRYFGGGIPVALDANLDSGEFEVYVVNDLSLLTIARYLHTLYLGTYLQYPQLVRRYICTRVVAQSDERVLLDLDGEQPGVLPAEIELLPAALPLVVPKPA